jgi:hypothetical protein
MLIRALLWVYQKFITEFMNKEGGKTTQRGMVSTPPVYPTSAFALDVLPLLLSAYRQFTRYKNKAPRSIPERRYAYRFLQPPESYEFWS